MRFRVVDIETVPDLSVWTPGEAKWELQPGFRRDSSNEGTYAWFELGKQSSGRQGLTPCDSLYKKVEPFPPPQAQRVVAIAWCDIEMANQADRLKTYEFAGCYTRSRWTDDPATEISLLKGFREAMVAVPATLVSWNGRTFDLPVLAMRAFHHGVPWGWYYDNSNIRYRYSTEGHCDLMDFLSDFGAARNMKLDDVARLVGLPGKGAEVDHIDGSMVASIVAQGSVAENMARVARYCLQDVIQTALIFVRSRYHLEIVTAEGYAQSLRTFSESPIIQSAIAINWSKMTLRAPVRQGSDSDDAGF